MKNRLLAVVAAGEALTGLVLLVYPPIVVRLLFGTEPTGVSIPVARVLGIALMALGLPAGLAGLHPAHFAGC